MRNQLYYNHIRQKLFAYLCMFSNEVAESETVKLLVLWWSDCCCLVEISFHVCDHQDQPILSAVITLLPLLPWNLAIVLFYGPPNLTSLHEIFFFLFPPLYINMKLKKNKSSQGNLWWFGEAIKYWESGKHLKVWFWY